MGSLESHTARLYKQKRPGAPCSWRWTRRARAGRGQSTRGAAKSVASKLWIRSCVANHVYSGVLCMLNTVVQLDEMVHCGDLYLITKLDTANLGLNPSSRGGVLDKARLSSGLWIGRTSDLESFGSMGSSLHTPPLQMPQCCRRCLCWVVACT